MQWEIRAERQGTAEPATMTFGADDHGEDIMGVARSRLPSGEWAVRAIPASRVILRDTPPLGMAALGDLKTCRAAHKREGSPV